MWLSDNVFGRFKTLQSIIIGQGTLVFGLIVCSSMLVGVFILSKLVGNAEFITKIKEKIMWSPIFRSQIQTFFPTCLLVFEYFDF